MNMVLAQIHTTEPWFSAVIRAAMGDILFSGASSFRHKSGDVADEDLRATYQTYLVLITVAFSQIAVFASLMSYFSLGEKVTRIKAEAHDPNSNLLREKA